MSLLRLSLFVLPFAVLPAVGRAENEQPADKALLLVHLPAGAKLVIGASSTEQTGPERLFVSPALTPGKHYSYELKAEWTENGQPRTEIQVVVVSAGAQTLVAFGAPKKGGGPEDPAVKPVEKPVEKPAEAHSRSFQFTYSAVVTGLKPEQAARIWLPVAHSDDDQEASILSKELPAEGKIGREKQYGNEILYVEAKADVEGKIPVKVVYQVTRREVKGDGGKDVQEGADLLDRYLKADAKVPIDGKPLEMLKGKELPKDQMATARVIYDVIDDNLKYGKDKPGWGHGDSVWACDNKTGNCSDFHSLFMTLARSRGIPAKFEIGFPVPEKHGSGDVAGYHCWAKFLPEGKGWIPVDISEANKHPEKRDYYFGNLTEDRVAFSTGRDLILTPKQDGDPVNFLIYPYVEVDGKAWPQEKIQKKFAYQDAEK